MDFSSLRPVDAAVTLAVLWLALGAGALACVRSARVITGVIFPAGALVALALALTGLWAIGAPASNAVLPEQFHGEMNKEVSEARGILTGQSRNISLEIAEKLLGRSLR